MIFTERLETLRFLEQNLARDLSLSAGQLRVIHGTGIADIELQQIVEDFGRDRSPVRLLLPRISPAKVTDSSGGLQGCPLALGSFTDPQRRR